MSRKNSPPERVSHGQQQLTFAIDVRLNQIPEQWYQNVLRFGRANGIRDGDRGAKILINAQRNKDGSRRIDDGDRF